MKRLLIALVLFSSSSALFADEILSPPKACLNVDQNEGKPSGCKKQFRAADKINIFCNILKPGVYTINARFELQDNTRKNKPINVDLTTEDNWDFVYFWMTPQEHDDKFIGPWKITIYVHDEDGNTSEYSTNFNVTK